MLSTQQQIDYAAGGIAGYTGETSDQVLARILGNQVRPQWQQLALLERELYRLRQPGELVVKVLEPAYHTGA